MKFRIGNFGLIHDACGNTVGRVENFQVRDNLDRTRGRIDPYNLIKDNFGKPVGTIGTFGVIRDEGRNIFDHLLPKPVPPFENPTPFPGLELPKPIPRFELPKTRPLYPVNMFDDSRCRRCGTDPCNCYLGSFIK